LREIAQNVEAQIIRVPTGSQDYYPAMYGGVSAIELGVAGILRPPIPVDPTDFNERIVLGLHRAARQLRHQQLGVLKSAHRRATARCTGTSR